ncbi:hypothetical protein BGZ95_012174 [Linnemannia exigua]|uniref:Uncharacterized protein n=1 Tax=Linnemannia exigua TaxID=604196 RepID=A0AAD4H3Q7_9FUNG|nr:hypothetical protein BGZ95_012174 [Linnemannia exigua]
MANKQFQKKHRATRLLSAYESIVFSESQIPVFLTQDRHHHNKHSNQQHKQRKQRQQRPVLRAQQQGYIRIRKETAASQELDDTVTERNSNAERHQNPIRADTTDAEASSSLAPFSPVDDDAAVAQADDAHYLLSSFSASSSSSSASANSASDSGLEYSVAQDADASNNNNLQSDHVDDRGDDVGVTTTHDDKNSSSLLDNSHASTAATTVVVQAEQQEELEEGSFPTVHIAVMDENGEVAPVLEAVVDFEVKVDKGGAINPSSTEEVVVVVEEEEAVLQVESTRSGNEDEDEDGWVAITDADLDRSSSSENGNIVISSNNSKPSSNVVEFQSPDSDDATPIPFSDSDSSIHGPHSQEQQHHQHTAPITAADAKSLFHNGCSFSSTVVSLGLLLAAIGLAYRFYIRKLQQERRRRLALPFNDVKTTPYSSSSFSPSSSSSKSMHRLSVDSLPSPTMREGGARTTATSDYVGFNIH